MPTFQSRPKVSVILAYYNQRRYVDSCLSALLACTLEVVEIIVVDNDSADGTAEHISRQFPSVKLICSGENLGFSGANNLGVQHSQGNILVFLNPDTRVTSNWLSPLLEVLESDPQIGVVTPKILLDSQPDCINTCGLMVHFTGLPALRGWLEPAHAKGELVDVFSVSGAAFVMRRELFETLCGLDATFFPGYMDDIDLSWRVQLLGQRCIYVPQSTIYHDYRPKFMPWKYQALERNRYRMLLKNYQWRTLIALLPALLLADMVSWMYGALKGPAYLRARITCYYHILRDWPLIVASHRIVQQTRQVPDSAILRQFDLTLGYRQMSHNPLVQRLGRVCDTLFGLWYHLALRIIR